MRELDLAVGIGIADEIHKRPTSVELSRHAVPARRSSHRTPSGSCGDIIGVSEQEHIGAPTRCDLTNDFLHSVGIRRDRLVSFAKFPIVKKGGLYHCP
jgi:hypothetical protein